MGRCDSSFWPATAAPAPFVGPAPRMPMALMRTTPQRDDEEDDLPTSALALARGGRATGCAIKGLVVSGAFLATFLAGFLCLTLPLPEKLAFLLGFTVSCFGWIPVTWGVHRIAAAVGVRFERYVAGRSVRRLQLSEGTEGSSVIVPALRADERTKG